MSNAWKCACATLESRWNWETHRFVVAPSGYYNGDFVCAAKQFYSGLIPNRSVGGWVSDCRNYTCSAMITATNKCTAHEPQSWCDHCVVHDLVRDTCSYSERDDLTLCPFFRQRTAKEWMRQVLDLKLPLLTAKGKVRPEARAAKRFFQISDADFDALIKKCIADRRAAVEAAKEGGAK